MTSIQRERLFNILLIVTIGIMLLSFGLWNGRKYTRDYVNDKFKTYDSTLVNGKIIPMFDSIIKGQNKVIRQLNERDTNKVIK